MENSADTLALGELKIVPVSTPCAPVRSSRRFKLLPIVHADLWDAYTNVNPIPATPCLKPQLNPNSPERLVVVEALSVEK
jgi:hypothetical protein